jgi:hypothetical protein
MSSVRHVLDDATSLSEKGQIFLARKAVRVPYERGLVGDDLVAATHGRIGKDLVQLLDFVQGRYGGLRYSSCYFDADIDFMPTCEPEAGGPLGIDYVVVTGSMSGAYIDGEGVLKIALGEEDVVDFDAIENLIECDAWIDFLHSQPFVRRLHHGSLPLDRDMLRSLRGVAADVRRVEEASGRLTSLFAGSGLTVCINRAWSVLGGLLPPLVHVGAGSRAVLDNALDCVNGPRLRE